MGKKRKAKLITTLSLTVIVLAIMTTSAAAVKYTIDGDLSDWGVDLTGDWSVNETWVPNDGVKFIVEDNNDPDYEGHPQGYATGVHIQGIGSSWSLYHEPLAQRYDGAWLPEPLLGFAEVWDLEAMYVDEDVNHIYVAIVTSHAPDASGGYIPGDLALSLDGDDNTGEYGYEYGVKLQTAFTSLTQFGIYYLPDWSEPDYVPDNRPTRILSGGYVGTADGKYFHNGTYPPNDQGKPNWVIEMAIPKDKVGMAGKNLQEGPFPKYIHHTDGCGNDKIEYRIPEFLTIAIPVGAILGLIYVHRRKRQGKGKEE